MRYRILGKFGPDTDGWDNYAQWAGLKNIEAFYSIGGMRKDLFTPTSVEDWQNCINEDFKINIITNLEYAQKRAEQFQHCEIVGIIFDPKNTDEEIPANHRLLGYDILDEWNSVSLLTNWGGSTDGLQGVIFNRNALVEDINYAYQLKEMLRQSYSNDDHARGCEVWAVYKINF